MRADKELDARMHNLYAQHFRMLYAMIGELAHVCYRLGMSEAEGARLNEKLSEAEDYSRQLAEIMDANPPDPPSGPRRVDR